MFKHKSTSIDLDLSLQFLLIKALEFYDNCEIVKKQGKKSYSYVVENQNENHIFMDN